MFALVVAPSPGFLILIYVGQLQEQAIQEEKIVQVKKTTVYDESFYYAVHDTYAQHNIQWHVRKGCIAQLIYASSGLVRDVET
jgi:hypothetical protein